MKKVISVALIMVVCCLCFCGCGPTAKEGDEPGTAIIDDCYIEISSAYIEAHENLYSSFYVTVDFKNNSKENKTFASLATMKAFIDGREVSMVYNISQYDELLPGKGITLKYEVLFLYDIDYEIGKSECLIQISTRGIKGKVITEKTFNI